jgi:hypothetical protein
MLKTWNGMVWKRREYCIITPFTHMRIFVVVNFHLHIYFPADISRPESKLHGSYPTAIY